MSLARRPLVDGRRAGELAAAILGRRAGYLERFVPSERSPGRALIEADARYLEAILTRLEQAPEKNLLAFLEQLGIELIAADVARAPMVFALGKQAVDTRVPRGARVAAPPPPGASAQVVFETERTLGLMAARLEQVVSLWPGRDQWIDHSAALARGETIRPFRRTQLADTPHHLYLAHDSLLALAGRARVDVELELSQAGSEHLDVVWEYWDGEVWRGFRRQRPECEPPAPHALPSTRLGARALAARALEAQRLERDQERLDATRGFTSTGKVRLESECAESKRTTVGGIESFWIRGRLDEPLPPDPGQILPEVSRIRLETVIEQPLDVVLAKVMQEYAAAELASGRGRLTVRLIDGDGRPIGAALVEFLEKPTASTEAPVGLRVTDSEGRAQLEIDEEPATYVLRISLFDVTFDRVVSYEALDSSERELQVELTLQLGGVEPDGAFADSQKLDLTRPFYPFGQQPQPGSTFFLRADEAFAKPGARIELHVRATETPQSQFDVSTGGTSPVKAYLAHTITWQYWNGRQWAPLLSPVVATSDAGRPEALTASGEIAFDAPEDFAAREVEGTRGFWLRARLVAGAFGFTSKVSWEDGAETNTFIYVIHQPPALADLRLSYTWTRGPYHAERVLAYNDFAFADRSEQAKWPGKPFQPFQHLGDTLPALYLGFDRRPPVDRIGLYLDVLEDPTLDFAPALEWEVFEGVAWRALTADDETRNLRFPGVLSFTGSRDAAPLARFGRDLYFVRARQQEDGPPAEPELAGIHTNAVWASQWQTTERETLGTSTGQPRQAFSLRNAPVLEGERIEVRELFGARADVEWRALAGGLLAEDRRSLAALEERLAREGHDSEIEVGPLRLRRDADKRVVEAWVAWESRPHFRASGADDRHYLLDRGSALVRFGDGVRGLVPPLGADVMAREYRSGGGSTGNVALGRIDQLLAGIPGVESVSNARAAEGGADRETLAAVRDRGPRTLRHRGRALLPADFEVMALEASPAVAVAHARPGRDRQGRPRPGWLTLTIIPRSEERRPWPSFGLREEVRRRLEAHTDAALAAVQRLAVVGPTYQEVGVEATVVPTSVDAAGEVADAARATVERFLHPLLGGPERRGWRPGRAVCLSDLCVALERTPGVDHVAEAHLLLGSTLASEVARVPDEHVVAAGDVVIRVGASELESGGRS